MPEFFLELFSEEIPARMQRDGTFELDQVTIAVLAELSEGEPRLFFGPRRIAISAEIKHDKPGHAFEVRGPRSSAPESALAGFLRKNEAKAEEITVEEGYYVLRREIPSMPAREYIQNELPQALTKLSWPKSMRWGQSGDFTWVRPLRRILCLFDGDVIPIKLGPITASNQSEGHRFLSPGAFVVSSVEQWKTQLRAHHVVADQEERREIIVNGLNAKAADLGLKVAQDAELIDEVNGLVEWPVSLVGQIEPEFMDLPPEVRELSMKVNQRYFALRDSAGRPAPYFAFVANIEASDGGAAVVAGNERVLRARLSDARHFWDIDLKTPLDELLPKLDGITFHAKIGTQGDRVKRIAKLAFKIAKTIGADHDSAKQAEWAGKLSKADLVTGMVGEFPELQGIMGGYYAERNPRGWNGEVVGRAISMHYQPKGPSDVVPNGAVAISVALADKLDTLNEFFRIGEKPTGSGDPYALRRAALGVIRIILENDLSKIDLGADLFESEELFAFIFDRLKIKLRGEKKRFDVLEAVFAVSADGNLVRLMKRVSALTDMLETDDGINLHAAYKRAANILRIEDPEGKIAQGQYDPIHTKLVEERELFMALNMVGSAIMDESLAHYELYEEIMSRLASLRPAVDQFFSKVTVNDPAPEIRQNRLRLLARFRNIVHHIADLSKIEG